MFGFLRNPFKKIEESINYHVIISKEDADELEYYLEVMYNNPKGKEFRKYLKPSMVKKGYIFYTDSGVSFIVTSTMADGITIKAKRYVE